MDRDWPGRRTLVLCWLPTVVWMTLIFILSAQPDLPHPSSGWLDLVISSGAHVFLFGVLAVLWRRALPDQPNAGALALALTLLYAVSDEFHQAFVPGRTPDLIDLICDSAGAILGLWTWRALQRLKAR